MIKKLLLGAVLGGLVAFVWGAVSHMALGFTESSIMTLQEEDAAAQALMQHAPQSGVYMYPHGGSEEEAMKKMATGPIVFIAVRREGMPSIVGPMIAQMLIEMLGALVFTWLLLRTTGLSYLASAGFVALAALGGTIVSALPMWNWYGLSFSFVGWDLLDSAIGGFLSGLVIAKVVQPKAA